MPNLEYAPHFRGKTNIAQLFVHQKDPTVHLFESLNQKSHLNLT
jgi:hypothetical protein